MMTFARAESVMFYLDPMTLPLMSPNACFAGPRAVVQTITPGSVTGPLINTFQHQPTQRKKR